jgi:uncharacterized protein with PIN domain
MEKELLDMLWEYLDRECTTEGKFEFINDLTDSIINKGSRFGINLKEELQELCINKNICPECGNILGVQNKEYIHTELDYNNIENISYLYCHNCGWSSENE